MGQNENMKNLVFISPFITWFIAHWCSEKATDYKLEEGAQREYARLEVVWERITFLAVGIAVILFLSGAI